MRDGRAINWTAVSGRELCYVSEKEGFLIWAHFGPDDDSAATTRQIWDYLDPCPIASRDQIPREGPPHLDIVFDEHHDGKVLKGIWGYYSRESTQDRGGQLAKQ